MAAISIPEPLRSLCGLPAQVSADELRELLPAIVQTIGVELQWGRVEMAKSAYLVQFAFEHIPNPGLERAERLPSVEGSPADPDNCLNSLIPWGAE